MALTDIKININLNGVKYEEDVKTQEMMEYCRKGIIPIEMVVEYMRLRTSLGSILIPAESLIMWDPIESRFEILDL